MASFTPMEVDGEYGKEPRLESRFRTTPLEALRPSARKQIALLMDEKQEIIHEEIGMLTDWRGLAELVGFSHNEMLKMERTKSPTGALLSDWELSSDQNPTIGHFWAFMISLQRQDVLMECKSLIERDALNYIQTKERLANDYCPVQEDIITSTSPDPYRNQHGTPSDHYANETDVVTIDDDENQGNKVIYDAFICYNAKSENDSAFVEESIRQLEHNRGLRLCIPDRDCLAGGAKYVIDAHLIKSRCRRMVIVVSNDFLHSAACDFQVKFAHSLAPGARKKRLIPVLMEERLNIPNILRHVTICDFTKPDLMEWFWSRLATSVRAPLDCDEMIGSDFQPQPKFMHSQSIPVEETPEKMNTPAHIPTWPLFPTSRRSSSDSNSSGFSIVSASSLPDDIQGTTNQPRVDINTSPKRQHEGYVSFEDIIPRKKEPKLTAKRIFEMIQNKLVKNK